MAIIYITGLLLATLIIFGFMVYAYAVHDYKVDCNFNIMCIATLTVIALLSWVSVIYILFYIYNFKRKTKWQ